MRNISEYIIERNSPDKIRVTDKNGNNMNYNKTKDFVVSGYAANSY